MYSLPHISPDRSCRRAFPPFPGKSSSAWVCQSQCASSASPSSILLQATTGPWQRAQEQREQEGLKYPPTHLTALLSLSSSPFPSYRCIIVRKKQPPRSGVSPHLMLIFYTITISHTGMNTAFNALFSLIPTRDLICLHPEIIWHNITSYHKLQFLCLSWEVYFIPAFSPGQILKNDCKQRKSGLKKDGGKKKPDHYQNTGS